jgi:DNA-binding protein Fis
MFQVDVQSLILDGRSGAYQRLLALIEPVFLQYLLEFTQANKAKAARIAGINSSTLERKLKRYHMVIHKQISHDPITRENGL